MIALIKLFLIYAAIFNRRAINDVKGTKVNVMWVRKNEEL